MSNLRERWEGVSLPGDYLLERWLSGNNAADFFETPTAADGRRAIVKLVPEQAADAAGQLALWQHTRQLQHPHLQELLDCGCAELAGETVLYAVLEPADDSLAAALAQAPLSENEAREVLEAVAGGLGYLQSQGLAHPALDPEHVLAVRERIKLSADALRESAAGTPDTGQLRAFWSKISPCTPARSAEILAEALGETAPAVPSAVVAVPTAPPEAVAPAARALDLALPPPKRFPKWILVGAAGVVLLILGLNIRRAPETPVAPAPARAPVVAAPVPKESPPAKAASKPSALGNRTWRVVVFTYRTRDAATRKADQINQRHPELAATVIASPGKKGNYLICLGGPMSRGDANRMEKKARAAHVARDVRVESGSN